MTRLEARIRQRLRPLDVEVFIGEDCVFDDDDAVKVRRRRSGVTVWTYWTGQVMEWWYPNPTEVRVSRG